MTKADGPPTVAAIPQGQADAPTRNLRRRVGLPLLTGLFAVLLLALAWDVSNTAWFQEARFSRMSLAALKRERDAKDSRNPLLLYYIGRRLNEQGKFTEADGYLREAVGGSPESARYRDAWARALLGGGLTTAAFGQLSQFAGTHPESAEAHLLLGKFYVTQNSLNRAVEELTKATRLDPHLGEAWSFLSVAHQNRDERHPAREAAEKAASLRPNNAGDQLTLAVLRDGEGDASGAKQAFEQTLRLAPEMAVAYREYARFLLRGGKQNRADAIVPAQRAVALDANDATAHLTLGRALSEQGQNDEALKHLEEAARLTPTDATPALAASQLLRRMGRGAEADDWMVIHRARRAQATEKDQLHAALELNPGDATAHRRLARLMAFEGDVAGCVQHQAAAAHKRPDSPIALAAAADDLASAGRGTDALALAQRACDLSPTNPAAFEALGNALLALGKPDEAIKKYHQVLNWQPKRYPIFRAKMDAYYQAEERRSPQNGAEQAYRNSQAAMRGQVRVLRVSEEALRLAEDAVRLAPDNAIYLRYLLRLQFHANRKNDAMLTARRLLERSPDDKATHTLLSVLLTDRAGGENDLTEAESHLNQAAGDAASAPLWHYGRGLLALRRGAGAEAARELREAARLDPNPAVTFYKLAQAEAKAGNREASAQAMAEYNRRHRESEAEAQALFLLGNNLTDPQAYQRAAKIFDSFGRRTDAAAIRAAAPPPKETDTQTKGKK